MKYKLLCTDMDGTLLGKAHEISDRNLEAIKKANEKGLKIAVCTGRLYSSAFYYAEKLGVKTPIISANGAFIREKDRDEIIYKSLLGIDRCKRIIEVCKKYKLVPHLHTPHHVFSGAERYSALNYKEFNKYLPEDKKIHIEIVHDWNEILEKYEKEIVKAIIIEEENKENLLAAKKELIEMGDLEVVSSFSNNFEVMCKDVSKGRAVEILASYYGITNDEIICIGDNDNDISMIEIAGLGVAMGNGSEGAKKVANYVTDTNLNDGVAKVIEKFILET